MSILASSDFTGQFGLAQSNTTDFSWYFERYEREYLVKLLGADLYGLFYADLGGDPETPTEDKYVTIFEPLTFDDGKPYVSHGIKFILKCFVFYHFIKDNNLYHSIAGLVSNNVENAVAQIETKGAQYITTRYQEALESFEAIQVYIQNNLSDYPDFNGVEIQRSPVFW